MATPKAPTMLAVGRRRGFETTVEPDLGGISASLNAPTLILTSPSGLSAEGVTGTLETDGTIVISALPGEIFSATGPTVRVFEDGRNASDDQAFNVNTPEYGSWSAASSAGRWSSAAYVSRGRSAHSKFSDGTRERAHWIEFPNTQEIYMSFWVRCSIAQNQITAGQFKVTWLMDGSDATGNPGSADQTRYDLCVPTIVVNTIVGGNFPVSSNISVNHGTLFAANQWARFSCWMKGVTDANIYRARILRPSASSHVTTNRTWSDALFWDDSVAKQFNALKIPGFISQAGHDIFYDDMYVATGDGACARVEIGDNLNYSQCLDLRPCYASAWSSSTITANVDPDFTLSGKYIHIHDATDTHTNGGVGRLIS